MNLHLSKERKVISIIENCLDMISAILINCMIVIYLEHLEKHYSLFNDNKYEIFERKKH